MPNSQMTIDQNMLQTDNSGDGLCRNNSSITGTAPTKGAGTKDIRVKPSMGPKTQVKLLLKEVAPDIRVQPSNAAPSMDPKT